MAHHINKLLSETNSKVKEVLQDLLHTKQAKVDKLGPTGEFPEGKLVDHDEGEIRIAVGTRGGKVVIEFSGPVHWIGFTPEQAEDIGNLLKQRANEARANS